MRTTPHCRDILEGIGTVYRVYPVRKGESLADIIERRKISTEEIKGLNPGVNLDRLKGWGRGRGLAAAARAGGEPRGAQSCRCDQPCSQRCAHRTVTHAAATAPAPAALHAAT